MKKAKLTRERALREAVRILVRKMIKEAEETEDPAAEEEAPEDAATANTATPTPPAQQEPPKEEPKEEPAQPEPAPEEEEGLNADFQAATDMFIRKLTQSTGTPSADDLVDMMSQMVERFTTTSEERLNLLKGIRDNTVH